MPPGGEWIAWLERLSSASLGVLMGLVLAGSYFGIWMWERNHRERVKELTDTHGVRVAELLQDIEELKEEKQRWQDMALGLLNPLEQVTTDRLADRKRG